MPCSVVSDAELEVAVDACEPRKSLAVFVDLGRATFRADAIDKVGIGIKRSLS
jgi:hypothetical protein